MKRGCLAYEGRGEGPTIGPAAPQVAPQPVSQKSQGEGLPRGSSAVSPLQEHDIETPYVFFTW